MVRRVLAGCLCAMLVWMLWGDVSLRFAPRPGLMAIAAELRSGEYPVQQAEYDDATGEYTLMVLNAPPGQSPVVKTDDLQMMALTEAEVESGRRSYLTVADGRDNGQAVLHLAQDFRIEYVHAVTQTQPDPQTGQPQTVVVRRESSFWSPFAGALAGQAIGSLLFSPTYYVPPMYQSGGVMTGYGGYGNTYTQAVSRYQQKHNESPPAVKNRQALRTTGTLRNRDRNRTPRTTTRNRNSRRSTGSGFGSSRLRGSSKSSGSRANQRSRSSFGSGRSRSRSRSFGRRRR